MPTSLCGTWDMISNVNFDGYMSALGEFEFKKILHRMKTLKKKKK